VTAPAAPGMLLNPLPRVTIDGVLIATDAAHVATQPVTLAGASVTWGRARAMDQMDPPTAALQVFDPTGTWALGLRPGLPVLLEQHAPLQSGAPVAMFRGRIAGVSVTPRTVGGIDGWQVALTCTSLLLDLANLIPQTAWPAETVAARAARLSIECGSSGGGLSVTFPTITGGASWGTGNVAAVPAGSQVSIWDHLLNLFDSVSTMRLSYLPGPHRFYGLPRRRYDTLRTLARLTRDTTGPRGGAGAYVTTVQTPTDATSPAAVPQFLDGGQVTRPAVGVSRDQGSRLTRARVTYADAAVAGAAAAVEAYVPNVNEIIDGAKVFAQSSIITDAAWAAQQATDLALWANEEQQGWRLPPLSWRVRDGFTTADQAAQFLACGESAVTASPERLAGAHPRPVRRRRGARRGAAGAPDVGADLRRPRQQFHATVEPLVWPGCWGWADRPIRGQTTGNDQPRQSAPRSTSTPRRTRRACPRVRRSPGRNQVPRCPRCWPAITG
jgi:hypothetical protein